MNQQLANQPKQQQPTLQPQPVNRIAICTHCVQPFEYRTLQSVRLGDHLKEYGYACPYCRTWHRKHWMSVEVEELRLRAVMQPTRQNRRRYEREFKKLQGRMAIKRRAEERYQETAATVNQATASY